MVLSEEVSNLFFGGVLDLELAGIVDNGEPLVTVGAGVDTDLVEVRVEQVLPLGATAMRGVDKEVEHNLPGDG